MIYTTREGCYEPPTGPYLGDMTDELEDEYGVGSYITEFVSGGPKNYGFNVYSSKKNKIIGKCKVKGFTLNYETSNLINFESMKRLIQTWDLDEPEPILVSSKYIRRTKEHAVITKPESKMYRPTNAKRKFLDDYDSLPFGYKKICT